MKEGRSLSALAAELERQLTTKEDMLATQGAMAMKLKEPPAPTEGVATIEPRLAIAGIEREALPITQHAHSQIASHLSIPAPYYNRMLSAQPELLAHNVNTWLAEDSGKRRMIRLLDGRMRAFLSDRYLRIEHYDICRATLEALAEAQADMQIVSCEVTEQRLYIKAVFPRLRREVAVGDVIEAGVMVRNSETGVGAADVTPFANRLICKNGMVIPDARFRAAHIGGKIGGAEDAYLLADDTKKTEDKAILLRIRDYVRGAADEAAFERRIEKMSDTRTRRIEGDPVKAVEILAKQTSLFEGERAGVMRHLIEGGDLSQWGLINAVTRTAADIASYDRATELETIGGKMLDMSPRDWRVIAEAA